MAKLNLGGKKGQEAKKEQETINFITQENTKILSKTMEGSNSVGKQSLAKRF